MTAGQKYPIPKYKIVGGATLLLLFGLMPLVSMNSKEQNLESLAAESTTIEPENGTPTGNVTVMVALQATPQTRTILQTTYLYKMAL